MPAPRKFRFALDPLLKLRERVEQDKQRILAGHLRRQVAIENRLREIHERIQSSKAVLADRLGGEVDTHAIRAQANLTMALDQQARVFALELAEVYKLVDQARRELLVASKERKSMERLRERRYEAWQTEVQRAEVAEADDLTMTRTANHGVSES